MRAVIVGGMSVVVLALGLVVAVDGAVYAQHHRTPDPRDASCAEGWRWEGEGCVPIQYGEPRPDPAPGAPPDLSTPEGCNATSDHRWSYADDECVPACAIDENGRVDFTRCDTYGGGGDGQGGDDNQQNGPI